MKKWIVTLAAALLLPAALPSAAFAQELLVGGQVVGIQFNTAGVFVAGLTPIETAEGPRCPAQEAGVEPGDLIVAVDGKPVENAADFIGAVAGSRGEACALQLRRGGQELSIQAAPVQSAEQQWMLGMWLRDGVNGIGTLTFCEPESGTFGALGHAVSDEDSGEMLPLGSGSITEAQVTGVVPGREGQPGELDGCADLGHVLGLLEKNTDSGIYGRALGELGGRLAETGDAKPGPAVILCAAAGGEPREYAVRIERVVLEGGCRRLQLTVTDPELRELTGGIVQGMSGSPILQEDKLVGAVTHVFVST